MGIHVERVLYDEDFVSNMMQQLDVFFIKAVLPKVLLWNI